MIWVNSPVWNISSTVSFLNNALTEFNVCIKNEATELYSPQLNLLRKWTTIWWRRCRDGRLFLPPRDDVDRGGEAGDVGTQTRGCRDVTWLTSLYRWPFESLESRGNYCVLTNPWPVIVLTSPHRGQHHVLGGHNNTQAVLHVCPCVCVLEVICARDITFCLLSFPRCLNSILPLQAGKTAFLEIISHSRLIYGRGAAPDCNMISSFTFPGYSKLILPCRRLCPHE